MVRAVERDMSDKYEVWGRVGNARKRLRGGFTTEAAARRTQLQLGREGFTDLVVVQRPPSYGAEPSSLEPRRVITRSRETRGSAWS